VVADEGDIEHRRRAVSDPEAGMLGIDGHQPAWQARGVCMVAQQKM
jgi:hypothetical protein